MTQKPLTFKLTGFEDFSDTLKDLPDGVTKRVSQNSVNAAMRSVVPDIAKAAPRGDIDDRSPTSEKYGPLHKNIKAKRLKKVPKWEKGARIDTGAAPQGFWAEKGTRYQPARPWFLPAFSGAVEKILSVLYDKVGAGIEKEARKK